MLHSRETAVLLELERGAGTGLGRWEAWRVRHSVQAQGAQSCRADVGRGVAGRGGRDPDTRLWPPTSPAAQDGHRWGSREQAECSPEPPPLRAQHPQGKAGEAHGAPNLRTPWGPASS